jgi:single-stranded DNA-binding protein
MSNIKNVILIGCIGNTPQIEQKKINGMLKNIIHFIIDTNLKYDTTKCFNCEFITTSFKIEEWLKKGTKISVFGYIEEKSNQKIIVKDIRFLEK